MCFSLRTYIEKIDHGVEKCWRFDEEKITAVSKEGHAGSFLWHEKTRDYWFSWKRWKYKQYFLLVTSYTKSTLFIE